MNLSWPATAASSSVLVLPAPAASSFSTTIRCSSHRPRPLVDRPGCTDSVLPLPPSPNYDPLVATIPRPPELLATDYLVVFVVVQTHRERVATPVHVHEPRRLPSQCRRHSARFPRA